MLEGIIGREEEKLNVKTKEGVAERGIFASSSPYSSSFPSFFLSLSLSLILEEIEAKCKARLG